MEIGKFKEAELLWHFNSITRKSLPMSRSTLLVTGLLAVSTFLGACNFSGGTQPAAEKEVVVAHVDSFEYFLFRPKVEKEYGYSHAVRIGDHIKISGAVSMDDNGVIVAPGSMEQQMKNCYSDLEKILAHYGCTFDDVYAENIYTTNMEDFIKVSGFRNSIYKKQFPTGTWLEVKGLALKGQLIEIDMEAHKAK